ncbi:protein disulfide isomerase pTAC5, chloroplastic isoform X2 [Henckelia pumila]|uniref:protein disulfide isomerase pTAC5, chloroplastic isoform X2 n=1 Tax=Henckelia pumila TaxID=405737 RepID=UPI003C6E181F
MSSILPLTSNFGLPFLHSSHKSSIPFKSWSKSQVCFSFSPSKESPIGYGPQEEARWLREEQRWLREEQRWLREEGRWKEERQRLVQEINSLRLRVQELEQLNSLPAASVSDTLAHIAKLLQVVKDGDSGKNVNRITESGSSAVPLVVEAAIKNEEVVVKEVISVSDGKEIVKRRVTLRNGSEGEEVRALQDALQKLGFYSGEEDIEFSSFSSGTERAVKTWQSSIGAREDGVMTAELLEQLFMEQKFGSSGPAATKSKEKKSASPKKSVNGSPISSTTGISEVQKTGEGASEASYSPGRVFLLGENRWEEPSRLSGSSKRTVPIKTGSSNATVVKCLACYGEGRVLCMECDGTGEPNIEPQFLEWVDEGTKCPYCEGLGFTTCDVCGGPATTDAS